MNGPHNHQKQEPRKPRAARVEHSEDMHIDDESGELWAVSYADFLMVLLSFFILFFSIDEEKKENVIQSIVDMNLGKGSEGQGAGAGPGEGPGKGPGEGEGAGRDVAGGSDPADLKKFSSMLSKFKIETVETEETLTLMLPDNIYATGSVELDTKSRKMLSTLLAKLKPYLGSIELIFIGHTDQLPVTKTRTTLLENNFDLSVLRASKALQFAISQRLPTEFMSAKGSANKQRNSRSLSLFIRTIDKEREPSAVSK